MTSFANLLRGSRIVATPSSTNSASSQFYPIHQAIRSTKASQDAGDWGLKRALPNQRTKSIAVSSIDTQEHQTAFTSANKYTKFVQRWQEMGVPLSGSRSTELYSWRGPETVATAGTGDKHLPSMSHEERRREIGRARRYRTSFRNKQGLSSDAILTIEKARALKQAAANHLGLSASRPMALHESGGLAYHPKGALSLLNTPDGPREKQITARILHSNPRAGSKLGLGGLIAGEKVSWVQPIGYRGGRDTTVKVTPGATYFDLNGELIVQVSESASVPSDGFAASKRRGDLQAFGDLGATFDLDMEDVDTSLNTPKRISERRQMEGPRELSSLEAALIELTSLKDRTKKRQ